MPEAELQQAAAEAFHAASPTAAEAPEAAEAPAVDPIEAKALELGWNPDYAGEGAKSAAEWVIQKLDRAQASNQKLRTRVHLVTTDAAKIQRQAQEQVERQLKAQRAQAIEEGNVPAVEVIDERLEEVRRQKAQTQVQPDMTPVIEWKKSNAHWFDPESPRFDRERAEDADAWFTAYLNNNPGDLEGAVDFMERKLRRAYPDKPAPRQQAPRVEGRHSVTGGGKATKGFADLPDDAKQAAITFERRGAMSRHDYAKNFWSTQ